MIGGAKAAQRQCKNRVWPNQRQVLQSQIQLLHRARSRLWHADACDTCRDELARQREHGTELRNKGRLVDCAGLASHQLSNVTLPPFIAVPCPLVTMVNARYSEARR